MKSTDDLFQLIKSLDKSEKRYFRLFCSFQNGDKKYMQVFDAIEKQKEYDSEIIINSFEKDSQGKTSKGSFRKQFPVMKHYLYNLIMNSLRSYHSDIDSQLQSHLHGITILYEKRLYRQCEKLTAQAQRLAEKHEKHWFLAELKKWELYLIRVQSHANWKIEDITEHNRLLFKYINQYQNVNEYLQLVDKVYIHISKKNNARNEKEREELEQIIKHPLLKTEKKAISTEAIYRYNSIFSSYLYYTTNDYTKPYLYIKKTIDLLDAKPAYKEVKLEQYITTLNNLIVCQLQLKHYHDIPQNIQKLKIVTNSKKWLLKEWDNNIKLLEFGLFIKTGQFEKGLELIPKQQDKLLTKRKNSINLSPELIYHITLIYFGVGDFNKAKTSLNNILNDTAYDIRIDLHCFALIFQLIIHYELGDMDFINYKAKSAKQFLAKRKRLYKSEKLIVDFFNTQILKAKTKKQHQHAFIKLKKQFSNIVKISFEQKALGYFDFISWIESKIENKTYAEVVRRKVISNTQ